MSVSAGHRLLGEGIATVLRVGTGVTVGLITVGYFVALAGTEEVGAIPLSKLLAHGGGLALIGIGLLGLTVVPVVMLAVAGLGFWLVEERRAAVISAVVALLLAFSLLAAFALSPAG